MLSDVERGRGSIYNRAYTSMFMKKPDVMTLPVLRGIVYGKIKCDVEEGWVRLAWCAHDEVGDDE